MDASTIVLILVGIILLLLMLVVIQLILQNGRILTRIADLERHLDDLRTSRSMDQVSYETGLPPGTHATDFELPALDGGMHRLTDFLGDPIVLIFFDPDSIECQALLPDLAHQLRSRDASAFPEPIIISTGDPGRNRELFEAFDVPALVLLQEDDNVAGFYLIDRTPVAHLIDASNHTVGYRFDGAEAILALLEIRRDELDVAASIPPDAQRAAITTPYPERDHQLPCAPARGDLLPDFRLPVLGGGYASRDDFAGRQLLITFVDPICAPCDELLGALERLAHQVPHTASILIVSRREVALNHEMVARNQVSLPIALQTYWDFSDEFGRRSVPAGVMAGPDGTMTQPIAFGCTAIQSIAQQQLLA